tara:strand:- start:1425 stop:2252 length:828 start_codon:yes stop_codon:yes gene_type:complete
MSQMAKNLDNVGLKSIVNDFDFYFIDLWGVVHNGIKLFDEAVNALQQLENLEKNYVLLTNAPRPNNNVVKFLEKMGLDEIKSNKVRTSGQSSIEYLIKNFKNKKFFHIGPPRDFDLFKTFEMNKANEINDSDYFLCTGLFDDYSDDLKYYEKLLENQKAKVMICTNPDLIVDRGNIREYCAGSVAKTFEEIGGKVEYFGKPYPNVYYLPKEINYSKVLCIGDNLNTDIKGANNKKFKSLFIKSGVHKEETSSIDIESLLKKYGTNVDYIQTSLKW